MAVEREYRVTISGVLGRSTAAAFGEMIADATRAKKKIDEIFSAPIKGVGGTAKAEGKARVDEAQKAAQELARIREKENDAILRDVEKISRVKERAAREEQARQEKAERATASRNQKIASDALGYMRKAAGAAARVAGEVVSGLGIDMSLQRGVAKSVELEKMAVAIVNAGNRGTGSAAERNTEVTSLQTTARDIADKYKIDATQVLSGLGQYQALTGDLDTAKAGLEGLARLSKAFNVDLDKMVGAAGQVGSAIGDVGKEFKTPEDKARAILDVLKQATAQGQEGAIEISDLATQYAKLKAAGMRFEGNTGDNISKMSALAQLAYQTGGAGSVREASNAVMGFVNTLNTPARRAEFKALGINLENDKGQFLDPYQLIKQSLAKTGGDTDKMNALFKNVVGYKAVSSFVTAYKGAGGGDAGMKAVDAQFARFGGKVDEGQISENLERALNTKESKAQDFQNRIDRITSYMADRLIPALEKLEEPAASLANILASVVTSAAEHPWGAVAAIIGGSIATAIAKQFATDLLAKAITSGIGGKGLAIGAITATVAMAYMMIREFNQERDKAGAAEKEKLESDADLLKRAQSEMASGKLSRDTINEIAKRRAELGAASARGGRYNADEDVNFFEKFGAKVYENTFGEGDEGKTLAQYEGGGAQNAKDKASIDAMTSKMDQLIAEFVKANPPKAKGPQEVVIVGGLPGGGVAAPTAGTVAQ